MKEFNKKECIKELLFLKYKLPTMNFSYNYTVIDVNRRTGYGFTCYSLQYWIEKAINDAVQWIDSDDGNAVDNGMDLFISDVTTSVAIAVENESNKAVGNIMWPIGDETPDSFHMLPVIERARDHFINRLACDSEFAAFDDLWAKALINNIGAICDCLNNIMDSRSEEE